MRLPIHSSSAAPQTGVAAAMRTAGRRFPPAWCARYLASQTASRASPPAASSADLIQQEARHVAHNYSPLPVVISQARGARVWDPEGVEYLDFLSAYSAVNQGHCHPTIVRAAAEQLEHVTLTSRAFYNDQLPTWAEMMTRVFKYDAVLPMNTGAEAVETAVKLARRWGSMVKKVPNTETVIISACGSFHGRTLTAISLSSDPVSTDHHGPLAAGVQLIPYGDVAALRLALAALKGRAVAFIVEPIQGEGGVLVPPDGYLRECHDACKEFGALLIADEVQTGLARTGRLLASEWDGARPDLVILGKALGGGVYPISAVLADEEVMGTVTPGVHGSTFGGNPLGCAVSLAALGVIFDEQLTERASALGKVFESVIAPLVESDSQRRLVLEQRGRGLLRAIELDVAWLAAAGATASDFCYRLKECGVLAKTTRESTVRFAPPLVISEEELIRGAEVVAAVVREFEERCEAASSGEEADAPRSTRAAAQRDARQEPCHRGDACCVHFSI